MYFCSLNALSESPRPVLHEKTRLCKTVCTGAYSDRRKQKRGRAARALPSFAQPRKVQSFLKFATNAAAMTVNAEMQ